MVVRPGALFGVFRLRWCLNFEFALASARSDDQNRLPASFVGSDLVPSRRQALNLAE